MPNLLIDKNNNTIMYHCDLNIRFYEAKQIAYPVGKNSDAYYIVAYVSVGAISNVMHTSKYTVVKNYHKHNKEELIELPTYQECHDYIQDIVSKELNLTPVIK